MCKGNAIKLYTKALKHNIGEEQSARAIKRVEWREWNTK